MTLSKGTQAQRRVIAGDSGRIPGRWLIGFGTVQRTRLVPRAGVQNQLLQME